MAEAKYQTSIEYVPKSLKRGEQVTHTRGSLSRVVQYLKKINQNMCTIINEHGKIEIVFIFELEKMM